jgi:NADH-quinone oxidoreductase subunit C/D
MAAIAHPSIQLELQNRAGGGVLGWQSGRDGVPTLWATKEKGHELLRYLKNEIGQPYRMLYDLTAIDERVRRHRDGQPDSDFTVVYHLLSFDRNEYLRVKVPLKGDHLALDTATDIWPAANWYEREVWDMFGIVNTDSDAEDLDRPPTA